MKRCREFRTVNFIKSVLRLIVHARGMFADAKVCALHDADVAGKGLTAPVLVGAAGTAIGAMQSNDFLV